MQYLKGILFLFFTCFLAGLHGQDTAPIVHLTADVVLGDAPLIVNFSALGTNDLEGESLQYYWNFGDGTLVSNGPITVAHTYNIPGIYKVSLSVLEAFDPLDPISTLSGLAEITITVRAPISIYDIAFKPIADATLRAGSIDPNIQYLRLDNGVNYTESFLKFDTEDLPACGTINGTRLAMSYDALSPETGNVEIHLGSHNSWTESNLSPPPTKLALLDAINTTYNPGDRNEWDLGGTISPLFTLIASTDTPNANFNFASSEAFVPGTEPCFLVEMDNTTNEDCRFPSVTIAPKVILQGAFNPIGAVLMNDDLRQQGIIPVTDPYGLMTNRTFGTDADYGDRSIVDWVMVELRDKVDPTIIITQVAALLRKDGQIMSPENILANLVIDGVEDGDYYVAIHHRNHLAVMTVAPVTLNDVPAVIDFTN